MKKQILIIEDNSDISAVIKIVMDGNELDVTWAESGESGVAFLSKKKFDVVLLDMNLGDMSGFELLKQCDLRDAYIVVMSGDEGLDKEALTKLGVCYFLQKPFGLAQLSDVVFSCIEGDFKQIGGV